MIHVHVPKLGGWEGGRKRGEREREGRKSGREGGSERGKKGGGRKKEESKTGRECSIVRLYFSRKTVLPMSSFPFFLCRCCKRCPKDQSKWCQHCQNKRGGCLYLKRK